MTTQAEAQMEAVQGVTRVALSVPEAAFAAGVSRSFIYEAIAGGALASVKLGKRRVIRPADLEAWVSGAQGIAK